MTVGPESQRALIEVLADGRFHSGAVLAQRFGLTRAAIWKRIRKLAGYGLEVERVRGRGYRLSAPLDLLNAEAIRAQLARAGARQLHDLEVLPVVDSTNRHLVARARELPAGEVGACLAECQTAGQGRRGRVWISPFGANLYCSVAWHLRDLPPAVGALSLVAGLAAAGGLERCGFAGIELKWPNDLLYRGRKLGGVLVDLQGRPAGACRVVVGVGINVAMPPAAGASVGQPWIDLASIGSLGDGFRNHLAGRIIASLLTAVDAFARDGFEPFAESWRARDAMAGREADLLRPGGTLSGKVLGVDRQGALRLQVGDELQHHVSGEVSLRESDGA